MWLQTRQSLRPPEYCVDWGKRFSQVLAAAEAAPVATVVPPLTRLPIPFPFPSGLNKLE